MGASGSDLRVGFELDGPRTAEMAVGRSAVGRSAVGKGAAHVGHTGGPGQHGAAIGRLYLEPRSSPILLSLNVMLITSPDTSDLHRSAAGWSVSAPAPLHPLARGHCNPQKETPGAAEHCRWKGKPAAAGRCAVGRASQRRRRGIQRLRCAPDREVAMEDGNPLEEVVRSRHLRPRQAQPLALAVLADLTLKTPSVEQGAMHVEHWRCGAVVSTAVTQAGTR